MTVNGTQTTAPGTEASVVNMGDENHCELFFTIPQGPTGPAGATGQMGPTGPMGSGTLIVGQTVTSLPGSDAKVTDVGTGENHILDFSIPRGSPGADGQNATIQVGTTTTTSPETDANVTNTGSAQNAILNFSIPRGATGADGTSATIKVNSTSTAEPNFEAEVKNSGTDTAVLLDFLIPRGATGASETIIIGNTTTGDAGTDAIVIDRTGTPNHTLDFVIPRGVDASETAGYFVTLGNTEGIVIPDTGLEIASGGRIPISRKEMDTTNAFTLDTTENTIKFAKTGTFEMTFVVNGLTKKSGAVFDPGVDFSSVGFRAVDDNIVFVGANEWSSDDTTPHQIVGTGMFVANDPEKSYELVNLHNQPLYLFSGKKDNTLTVSYFTTPVLTLRIRQIR